VSGARKDFEAFPETVQSICRADCPRVVDCPRIPEKIDAWDQNAEARDRPDHGEAKRLKEMLR